MVHETPKENGGEVEMENIQKTSTLVPLVPADQDIYKEDKTVNHVPTVGGDAKVNEDETIIEEKIVDQKKTVTELIGDEEAQLKKRIEANKKAVAEADKKKLEV